MNIALGKPVLMSSLYRNANMASNGNDGNYDTRFLTKHQSTVPWWAIDFGHEKARVTRIRITNTLEVDYRCKCLKCRPLRNNI